MAGSKKGAGSRKGTGKGEIDIGGSDSAARNDAEDFASEGETSTPPEGKNEKGNSTGKDGPLAGTGADALPNAGNKPAPRARDVADPKAKTKEKWLDSVYTLHGRHYGPSRFPGDYITVPEDFPDHIGGEEPDASAWKAPATSNVHEIPPDNNAP
jgi:hypothetical protein